MQRKCYMKCKRIITTDKIEEKKFKQCLSHNSKNRFRFGDAYFPILERLTNEIEKSNQKNKIKMLAFAA